MPDWLQFFLNFFLIFLWHYILQIRYLSSFVNILFCNFTKYLDERWNLNILCFFCGFNSEDRKWEAFHIKECINHKVLLFIDKTLTQFFDNLLFRISLVKHLDVLSSRDLSLSYDSLLVLHNFGFVIVNERIIFSYFSHNIINLFICSKDQESFFDIEILFFYTSWDSKIIVSLISNKKEFLYKSWRRG